MMKLVILVGMVSMVLGGSLRERRQLQPLYRGSNPTYTPKPTIVSGSSGPVYRILRLDSDILPEGRYNYAYETENGISAQESGELRGTGETGAIVAQGSYQYTSPEGYPIQIQYVSDENGYQPTGIIISGNTARKLV